MSFWKKNKNDNYSTPKAYLEVIDKFIPQDYTICDPFYFDGSVKDTWREIGREIIHENTDFFTNNYDDVDIIVSNPPFSNMKEIFIKLFEINKPFILLIPIQKIFQLKIQKVLIDKDIQIIVSPIYIGFINEDGEQTRCPSQYFCYMTYKMDLKRDFLFIEKP